MKKRETPSATETGKKRIKHKKSKHGKLILLGVVLLLAVAGIVLNVAMKSARPDFSESEYEEITGQHRKDAYTILLLGTDKSKVNTDTILVASYDAGEQSLHVMSIPRDTMVNAPWDIKKINSVYSREGIEGMQDYLGKLLGFRTDCYAVVDLSAFVELVDAIGGVEFDVPQNMKYSDPSQDLYINLKKGVQVLDGENAMGLVRYRRYGSGDIGRISVQQDFMKVLLQQCLSMENWDKVSEYISIFHKYVDSDLSLSEMLSMGRQMMDLNLENVSFVTMPGNYDGYAYSRTYHANQSYVLPDGEAILELVNADFNPFEYPLTIDMLDIMSINANGELVSTSGVVADTAAIGHRIGGSSQKSEPKQEANTKTETEKKNSKKHESQETIITTHEDEPIVESPTSQETEGNPEVNSEITQEPEVSQETTQEIEQLPEITGEPLQYPIEEPLTESVVETPVEEENGDTQDESASADSQA